MFCFHVLKSVKRTWMVIFFLYLHLSYDWCSTGPTWTSAVNIYWRVAPASPSSPTDTRERSGRFLQSLPQWQQPDANVHRLWSPCSRCQLAVEGLGPLCSQQHSEQTVRRKKKPDNSPKYAHRILFFFCKLCRTSVGADEIWLDRTEKRSAVSAALCDEWRRRGQCEVIHCPWVKRRARK